MSVMRSDTEQSHTTRYLTAARMPSTKLNSRKRFHDESQPVSTFSSVTFNQNNTKILKIKTTIFI